VTFAEGGEVFVTGMAPMLVSPKVQTVELVIDFQSERDHSIIPGKSPRRQVTAFLFGKSRGFNSSFAGIPFRKS
jgi:hypothetical protein